MLQTKIITKISVCWLLLLILSWPVGAIAQSKFDPTYILSDQDILDYQSLTLDQIKKFLQDKQSSLLYYRDSITGWAAPEIIYHASQTYQINPKYLLVLLQKEQSLIQGNNLSSKRYDWATGYGLCDDCSMDDPLLLKYKGFFNQVIWSAKIIRERYLPSLVSTGKTSSGFGPGIAKRVNGQAVVPANKATAILYTYTPHFKGNELLWRLWNKYFSRSYPDGSLLNVEGKREVWLIQDGVRKQFASRAVYLSYYPNFDKVLTISEGELQKYAEGGLIKFPVYSFLQSPVGTVYILMPNGIVRGFASRKALKQIGINPEEISKVSFDDLAEYEEGQPITETSIYPLGQLIQNNKTGGIYWVQDNIKHPIFSKEILKANFGSRKVTKKMTPAELDKFTTGDPLLFKDGDLIRSKTDTTVYVVSNSQRRPILNDIAFKGLGYETKNIIVTTDNAVNVHALGEPIGEPF